MGKYDQSLKLTILLDSAQSRLSGIGFESRPYNQLYWLKYFVIFLILASASYVIFIHFDVKLLLHSAGWCSGKAPYLYFGSTKFGFRTGDQLPHWCLSRFSHLYRRMLESVWNKSPTRVFKSLPTHYSWSSAS